MQKSVVCVVSLKEKKILLVKKKRVWILPGGKPKEGESDRKCLMRELKEELPLSRLHIKLFYREFDGTTPHSGELISCRVYFADVSGCIKPSAEISDSMWASRYDIENTMFLSSITRKIVGFLQDDCLI